LRADLDVYYLDYLWVIFFLIVKLHSKFTMVVGIRWHVRLSPLW